jgi:hypothetical protein
MLLRHSKLGQHAQQLPSEEANCHVFREARLDSHLNGGRDAARGAISPAHPTLVDFSVDAADTLCIHYTSTTAATKDVERQRIPATLPAGINPPSCATLPVRVHSVTVVTATTARVKDTTSTARIVRVHNIGGALLGDAVWKLAQHAAYPRVAFAAPIHALSVTKATVQGIRCADTLPFGYLLP